jgi:hypothetical protein
MLVRSRAVSGWPNLHVRAYATDESLDNALTTHAESHPSRLKVLRMERLAPAVLMVLIDGVPAVVHIEEPRQGLQFGVEYTTSGSGPQRASIHLRDNANGKLVPPERTLTATNSVEVPFRAGAPGVLDMTRLRQKLAQEAPNSDGTLEANEYALQMLRFPYRQVFGDPANEQGASTFELDAFKVSVALPAWRAKVMAGLAGGTP